MQQQKNPFDQFDAQQTPITLAPGNPMKPLGERAEVTSKQSDARVDTATEADRIRKARADAEAAATDAAIKRRQLADPNYGKSADQLTAERADAQKGRKGQVIRELMERVRTLYDSDLKGQPLSRGFGAGEYLPLPKNQRFNDAANNILPLIRPLVAQSSKEGDSDREMAIFQSYIPQAGDSDIAIEQKLSNLDVLVSGLVDGKPPSQMQREAEASAAASGGADAGPPTGNTRSVPDPEMQAQVDAFIRAGVPYQQANEYAVLRGATPIDPKQYADAVAYSRAHPGLNVSLTRATKNVPLSETEKRMDAIARSSIGSGIATFANGATGGLPTLLAGQEGNQALRTMRAANPKATMLGDISGGFAGMIGAGMATRGLGGLGKVGQFVAGTPGRAALTGDLAYGGLYGASESPDNRALGAAMGMGAAGAGNAVGRFALAPALRLGGHAMGLAPAKPAVAERMVMDGSDALDSARDNLQDAARLKLPFSLADADPRLRYVAGSAARINPEIRNMAEGTLNPRALGQADRAVAGIDQYLAPRVNLADTSAAIRSEAQSASRPFYDKAMSAPAPDDPALNDLLRAPIAESGLRDAYNIGLNNGVSPAEINVRMSPEGNPVLDALPNWRTLQLLKMGVDSQVEKGRGLTGKLNLDDPSVAAANDWRKRYVARLGDLNPDYAAGNAAYADKIGGRTALNRGTDLMKMTPDQASAAVSGTPSQHLPFLQNGYATTLGDAVERTRFSANPYDVVYGSPAAQQKIATAFPDGAPTFGRLADLEKQMATTRQEVLGGSPTQQRQIADSQFLDKASPIIDMGASIATGAPPSAAFAQGLKTTLKDAMQWGVGKKGQKKAATLGELLLKQDPQGALDMLNEFAQRQAAWKNYLAQSQKIGTRIAAPLAIAGLSSQP